MTVWSDGTARAVPLHALHARYIRPMRLLLPVLSLACAPSDGEVRRARPVDPPADTSADADTDTVPDDTVPDDTVPDDTAPGDTAPDDTAPDDTEPPPAALRIAVISDLNGSYGSTDYAAAVTAAVDAVLADPPDLVLSTGDMVAGQRSGLDYEAMWGSFHATVSDRLAAAGIPFAVTPGNHDASAYAGYSAERDAFADAWIDRGPDVRFVDDADYPFRYAFIVSDVLFVSLDDTLVGALDDEQTAWLDAVLDTPAAARIVYGHVPLFPFAEGRETEALFDDALEDLLVAHDVTAFISGHHHAYYPGRRGSLRLVGTACLGDSPRALLGSSTTSARSVLRLEVEEGEITTLEAWSGERFDTVIARSSLPASVGSGGDAVGRDDL